MVMGLTAALLVSTFILIKAANHTVATAGHLFNHSKTKKFGLAVFFLALSTSLPELMVSVIASINGNNNFALANIIGSNIANISLILGGAALIAGSLRASDVFVKKEVFYAFLMGTLPTLLLMDTTLTRLEGIGLCLLYIIYIMNELKKKKTSLPLELSQPLFVSHPHRYHGWKKIIAFGIGIIIMIFATESLVQIAGALAVMVKIPVFLISLILISIGTSLPELAFEISAIRQRQANMAFGNILGSIVANATLILGLSAIIHPITLNGNTISYLISVIAFILVYGLFWRFVWSKHRLDRWEGGILVIAYTIFAVVQYFLGK